MEQLEELMSEYSQSYEQIGGTKYSRFTEMWAAYTTRKSLARLEEEVTRQRTVIQSAQMAEEGAIQRALENLEEKHQEARRLILNPEQASEKTERTIEEDDNFRKDKWWESNVDPEAPEASEPPTAVETPVTPESIGLDVEGSRPGHFPYDPEIEIEEI